MQNPETFILHSAFSIPPVPVVERRPRERAKLEIQVRFLAGAMWVGDFLVPARSAGGVRFCLVSVKVRTAPCHGVRTGSIPVRGV